MRRILFGVLSTLVLFVVGCSQPPPPCTSADECYRLGVPYLTATGEKQNDEAAAKLFLAACDKGHAEGCARAGQAFLSGNGVTVDWDKASTHFKKACAAGMSSACSLGDLFSFSAIPEPTRTSCIAEGKAYLSSCPRMMAGAFTCESKSEESREACAAAEWDAQA